MQEKIKICLIIPSLRNGGSERVMSELANSWCKKEELDVFLVLLTNQDLFYKLDSSVTLIAPSRNYRKNVISKTIYKLWTFYYIRFTCKKIKPDTILSFNERYNNIVLLSLLRLRFNKYVSDRNNPYMNIGKIHNFLRNTLYKNITGIISGQNHLAHHENKMDRNVIPFCKHCPGTRETTEHFMADCPAYSHIRQEIFQSTHIPLNQIIKNFNTKTICKFINRTGRMEEENKCYQN